MAGSKAGRRPNREDEGPAAVANGERMTRDRVQWLVWLFPGWTFWLASGAAPQPDRYGPKRPACEHCGGKLHFAAITDGSGRVLVSRDLPQPALAAHATNYLDSG